MQGGGRLAIDLCNSRDWRTGERGVRVFVSDTGHGIPNESLTKIFEPFFSTKDAQGTGIGLWITDQLVKKYRGHIAVKSNTTGAHIGTTLSVFFPE